MKPFLFLGTRAEDRAADSEYAAFLTATGLEESSLVRRRLEAEPLGRVDLSDYAGIILGGGPFNISDRFADKSRVQIRVENELADLLDSVLGRDFPFLGCCYGIGTLGVRRGGHVDRTYGEPVGPATISLTDEGRRDRLFVSLSDTFEAYLGHKEAVARLPRGAVALASSTTCPVQAFRLGRNVYATQFHPELDLEGIETRIDVYADYGYFDPREAEAIKDRCRAVRVSEPMRLLERFVFLYGRAKRPLTGVR